MEKLRTKEFTSKDLFNASASTPIKEVVDKEIEVCAICVADRLTGDTVGYIKATDGTIYATISETVIDQLSPLADMVESGERPTIKTIARQSNGGRTYYQLQLI